MLPYALRRYALLCTSNALLRIHSAGANLPTELLRHRAQRRGYDLLSYFTASFLPELPARSPTPAGTGFLTLTHLPSLSTLAHQKVQPVSVR
ncbi:hypothetical protein EPA93_04360 [Ktedonosporobacter rubrisoli]|uniref:Uncharacterized protein n=1 Tax=Ktedonosporobacter rubrisoli TaxID=2509675 RepID=A0A4P6JJJ0_KTERU|nr:hypothetical protein [Ktedonosporobacter rubrisoli]QBD75269.1 hypothetical protein EPA93_04360 [Ktedonosporobacter rubrisoli]